MPPSSARSSDSCRVAIHRVGRCDLDTRPQILFKSGVTILIRPTTEERSAAVGHKQFPDLEVDELGLEAGSSVRKASRSRSACSATAENREQVKGHRFASETRDSLCQGEARRSGSTFIRRGRRDLPPSWRRCIPSHARAPRDTADCDCAVISPATTFGHSHTTFSNPTQYERLLAAELRADHTASALRARRGSALESRLLNARYPRAASTAAQAGGVRSPGDLERLFSMQVEVRVVWRFVNGWCASHCNIRSAAPDAVVLGWRSASSS